MILRRRKPPSRCPECGRLKGWNSRYDGYQEHYYLYCCRKCRVMWREKIIQRKEKED